ncbi:hypothetical protein [uncultured Thermosynechococcus sp.]|uniref:hypothetical protein n=1 Tax=uncultured Thermosynechococcus sp. TaxID=436945 RepID=UPI002639B340|nr:hypothetical protein [uncultured Thermosynechococcus sp.]
MENRGNGFGWGFVVGAVVGGIVGSIVTLLVRENSSNKLQLSKRERPESLNGNDERLMESMRLELEAKIAQINEAVDDLQHRLSNENES